MAEGSHDLEGKGVAGKRQDRRGRVGRGRLDSIVNNPDIITRQTVQERLRM